MMNLSPMANIYGFVSLLMGADIIVRIITIMIIAVFITNIFKLTHLNSARVSTTIARLLVLAYEGVVIYFSRAIWAKPYAIAFAVLDMLIMWYVMPVLCKVFYDSMKELKEVSKKNETGKKKIDKKKVTKKVIEVKVKKIVKKKGKK